MSVLLESIDLLYKMIPCGLSLNLPLFSLGPSPKGHGFHLWLSYKGIALFAWTWCNKFLILGFQEKSVFSCFGQVCLLTMAWRQGRTLMKMRWCLWHWSLRVIFFYLGCVCCCGYCWTLDDCVARELSSEMQSVKISLWSGRRMNNKANKWKRLGLWRVQ